MKKILLLVSGVMLSASVFAADALNTGAVTKIGKDTSDGAAFACDALSVDTIPAAGQVKVGLSKENLGALACSALDIAVGVASPKGKGKTYTSNSGGGALAEGDCSGSPQVCDIDQLKTATDTALTNSSS